MKQHLWTPWRMKFIEAQAKKKLAHTKKKSPAKSSKSECLFCQLPKKGCNDTSLVLFKGKYSFVILNRYPYSNGHAMVIPHRHIDSFEDITADEHAEMAELINQVIKALKIECKVQGINVGLNLGYAAGAGIKDHLHYHVVPRWIGDSNFMSAVGELRLIPEDLKKTYKKLKKYFKK